jgi:hypothetical protein
LVLSHLRGAGLYTRPTELKHGSWVSESGKQWRSFEPVLWDVISQWTMATEFAISRFLVPYLAKKNFDYPGWALFMDCDVLVRANICRLFDQVEQQTDKAVVVVKHDYEPKLAVKMDGQIQSSYSKKNWSSVCFFNCAHPSNDKLTVEMVNNAPGRDLHAFSWLEDDEIGEIGKEWNFLVGEYNGAVDPKIVHFTNGGPWMRGYEKVQFADEWREAHDQWAS